MTSCLLSSGLPHLLDESSDPDFRTVYGTLLRRSSALDAAISRMRLAAVDLTPDELRGVERIRVMLAEVNAMTLGADAEASLADSRKAKNLHHLIRLLEEEKIQVRSAPLAGWAPDFSVFRRSGSPWSVLVGQHWFARPYPHHGPALASLHGAEGARRTALRFERHWRRAHDIRPAVLHILRNAGESVGITGEGVGTARDGVGAREPIAPGEPGALPAGAGGAFRPGSVPSGTPRPRPARRAGTRSAAEPTSP